MSTRIRVVFYLMMASFIFFLAEVFVPVFRELLSGFVTFLLPLAVFFLLSLLLLLFTIRENITGLLKTFLLLTGISGAGIFTSILLHNFLYGLFVDFFGKGIWQGVGGDEPFFFIFGLIICPIGCVVGAVGTVYTSTGKN